MPKGGITPGAVPGMPRMTSLDHMFSTMTASSIGQNGGMEADERTAVEALANASMGSAASKRARI